MIYAKHYCKKLQPDLGSLAWVLVPVYEVGAQFKSPVGRESGVALVTWPRPLGPDSKVGSWFRSSGVWGGNSVGIWQELGCMALVS